ncbi:MAG TPA: RluA family pseudouridine synthase [Rectinemataceae bacterium]|nr:RluA family pseudouridine synthase [Rectinemataceae bacterium]
MAAKKKPKIEPFDSARPPENRVSRRFEAVVGSGGADRADRYIAEELGLLTRSQLKARNASIEVGGRAAKLSRPLLEGEHLVVTWIEEPSIGLVPESLSLDILFEDDRVIVVNKAQGMVTHPGAGNRRGTLANAILGHLVANVREATRSADLDSRAKGAAPLRGGIVHRLDKDTSGAIIVAKDAETQAFLAAQFKDRTTRKEYLAVTAGIPGGGTSGRVTVEGGWHRIESRLGRDSRDRKRFAEVDSGGKLAITDWRIVSTYGSFALVHLRPRSGRTHQLRVHLAGLGCPIVGDPIYGVRSRPSSDSPSDPTLMLHAWKLAIRLPGSAEVSQFVAPVPARFFALLRRLEARYGKKKTAQT